MNESAVQIREETPGEVFRERCERRILHADHLMMVVIDFNNGPWAAPDPMHSHPHEQVSYIASGEVLFFAEGQAPRHLRAGDLFAVPGNQPHSIQLLTATARLVDSFHPLRADFLPAPDALK